MFGKPPQGVTIKPQEFYKIFNTSTNVPIGMEYATHAEAVAELNDIARRFPDITFEIWGWTKKSYAKVTLPQAEHWDVGSQKEADTKKYANLGEFRSAEARHDQGDP